MKDLLLRNLPAALLSVTLIPCGALFAGEGTGSESTIASSYNEFGMALYRTIAGTAEGGNIFISPLSISLALAMTYNGASGETALEMVRSLGLTSMDLERINDSNALLLRELHRDITGARLDIANSLWARKGYEFNKGFLERADAYYGAGVRMLDFSSPDAKDTINNWVCDKTEGMIDGIVDRIDPLTILFVINAIYFKGAWTDEFDPERTTDEDFHLEGGKQKTVPMMHQTGTYRYFRGNGFQAVSLPYGDKRASMYLFLPDESSDLSAFHTQLSGETWNRWMKSFRNREGRIGLPRFKAAYRAHLKETLIELGMGRAFDGIRADFTDMIAVPQANAYIHDVVHKAVIEVNEEGTEAAAATEVEMRLTSAIHSPEEPFVMILDHPFFLGIRDNETGALLFIGSIVDPE
jgi:serine protease inhibitor